MVKNDEAAEKSELIDKYRQRFTLLFVCYVGGAVGRIVFLAIELTTLWHRLFFER